MTEETTPEVQPDVEGTAVPTPETQPATTNGEAERKFSQDEVNNIIKERLEREKSRSETAAKKAADEAMRKAAEEQGEFKKLYETVLQEKQAAEARAQALELATLRRDIAAKVGLPAGLASRLQGDNELDLEADAKALLATLPKPAAPSLDGGAGRGSQGNNAPSLDEIKELANIYGVDWRQMAKQHGVTVQ